MQPTCAVVAAVLLAGVAGFQLAAALGAPVGAFTQGGRHEGRLPVAGRRIAAISIVLLLVMAAVIVGKVGRGPAAGWSSSVLDVLWWITVAYLALGVVMNLASRSPRERMVFAPVTAVVLALTLLSQA